MHAGLAGLRRVSPPGHLQAVGRRSRAARQPRAGSATSGVPAAQPVRSRGAFCDEQSTTTRDWTAPGHSPGRLATGGRSAADGKRCSAARRADRDNSSVHRRVARCGAGQPRECGAAAGIGGGCEQVRGSCAPRPRLMRRAVRRRGTHRGRAAAQAPKWRPASPARLRAQRSQPPRRRPLLHLTRRSVRGQGTRQVPAPAPQWRPASPARLRAQRSQPPMRRPLLHPTRRSVRGQGTHQVPAPAPQWRPASPARLRAQRSHPPRRRLLLRPTRRSVRGQGTHQVPAPVPKWRRTSPAASAGMGAIRQGAGRELRRAK